MLWQPSLPPTYTQMTDEQLAAAIGERIARYVATPRADRDEYTGRVEHRVVNGVPALQVGTDWICVLGLASHNFRHI